MAFSFQTEIQWPLKNARSTPTLSLDSNSPCKDLLFPHTHKLCKNAFVLAWGTVPSRLDYQPLFGKWAHSQEESVTRGSGGNRAYVPSFSDHSREARNEYVVAKDGTVLEWYQLKSHAEGFHHRHRFAVLVMVRVLVPECVSYSF